MELKDMIPGTKDVIENYSYTAGALYLLASGFSLTRKSFTEHINETGRTVTVSNAGKVLTDLMKGPLGKYIIKTKQFKARSYSYKLSFELKNFTWKELYEVNSKRYPRNINDLKKEDPEAFQLTSKEKARETGKEILDQEPQSSFVEKATDLIEAIKKEDIKIDITLDININFGWKK